MGLSKKIAYRLQTLREAAKLSQQEVADKSDLSLSLIAKMEQGRKADPRASTILALAGALGVRPGELIEDLVAPPDDVLIGKNKKGKKKRKKKEAAADTLVDAPPVVNAKPSADGKPVKRKKKAK